MVAFTHFWRCPHNMRSRVYETVKHPSRWSTTPKVAGGFVAERPAGRRYRSTAAGRAPCSRRRCSAVNSGSVTLTAHAGGWTLTCLVFLYNLLLWFRVDINLTRCLHFTAGCTTCSVFDRHLEREKSYLFTVGSCALMCCTTRNTRNAFIKQRCYSHRV